MIRERGRARQRNGGQACTLDKMFGFLLIHHLTVIIPCLLLCEMCRPDPKSLTDDQPGSGLLFLAVQKVEGPQMLA